MLTCLPWRPGGSSDVCRRPPTGFFYIWIYQEEEDGGKKRQHIDSRPPRLMKNSSGRLAAASNICLPFNHGTSHPACLVSRRRSQRHVTPAARHVCLYQQIFTEISTRCSYRVTRLEGVLFTLARGANRAAVVWFFTSGNFDVVARSCCKKN